MEITKIKIQNLQATISLLDAVLFKVFNNLHFIILNHSIDLYDKLVYYDVFKKLNFLFLPELFFFCDYITYYLVPSISCTYA